MTDLAPGQVTIGDLYREIVGMRTDVARALERIAVIDSRNTDADQLHRDHETRLRVLESFRWKLIGIALAVSTVSGVASGLVGYLLGRH